MCEAIAACIRGCVKVILILINLIALSLALLLVGVGAALLVKGAEFADEFGVSLTPTAIAFIVLGILLLLVATFGCFGACTGRHALLNWYIGMILVVIVLEIIVLIYAYVNKSSINSGVKVYIADSFESVNNGTATNAEIATVYSLQTSVKCCGEAGPDSWTNADFNGEVPASCCVSASENATLCAKADAYELGCTEASQAVINSSQMLVYGVIMVVVIFQIICAIMAHLSKSGYEEVSNA